MQVRTLDATVGGHGGVPKAGRRSALAVPVRQLAGTAFVFVSLFPWVSLGTNTLDSQPWALLLACVFLFTSLRVPFEGRLVGLLLFVPAVLVVGLLAAPNFDFRFYRSVYGYASVPLLIVSYYIYVRWYGVPLSVARIANVIYLAAGILQQLFGPTVTGTLTVVRTTADRGVPSLAVEPTYFGILLLFFSWLLYVANDYRPRRADFALVAANVLFVLFVSRSSMAVLFMMVAILLALVYAFRLRVFALMLAGALVVGVGYVLFLRATRIGTLVRIVADEGFLGLVRADASVNSRVAHAVFSWHGAVADFFVPHGFSGFADTFGAMRERYGGFFWYGEPTNAIMSYAGAFVFELGWVGLAFLGYVFYLLFQFNRQRMLELALLAALLNSALPVAFPLIPLLVVVLYVSRPDRINARRRGLTEARRSSGAAWQRTEELATGSSLR
jgi:hypothetical protein